MKLFMLHRCGRALGAGCTGHPLGFTASTGFLPALSYRGALRRPHSSAPGGSQSLLPPTLTTSPWALNLQHNSHILNMPGTEHIASSQRSLPPLLGVLSLNQAGTKREQAQGTDTQGWDGMGIGTQQIKLLIGTPGACTEGQLHHF